MTEPHRSAAVRSDRWIERLLFCACFLTYLLTLNRNYPYDAVDYAYAVRTGTKLFHPHHLLYGPLGRQLFLAANKVVAIDAIELLARLNAFVTALSVVVAFRLARRLSGSQRGGLVAALVYACSFGIWHMGTSVEVYPLALLCELLSVNWLFARPQRRLYLLFAAIAGGLAALFHQTGVLFVVALGLALIVENRKQLVSAVLYCGIAGLVCLVCYAAAALSLHIRTWTEVHHWLFSYLHTSEYASGEWGGGFRLASLRLGLSGFLGAWAQPTYLERFASPHFRLSAIEIVQSLPLVLSGAAFWALLVKRCLRRSPLTVPPHRFTGERAGLVLWLVFVGLFSFWWVPRNFEFWLLVSAPIVILLAGALADLPTTGWTRICGCLIIAGLGVGNFVTRIRNDRDVKNNYVAQTLALLQENGLVSGDLVLVKMSDLVPYARYFSGLSICTRSLSESGYFLSDAEKLRVGNEFAAMIKAELAHHQVFFLETELLEEDAGWTQADAHHLYDRELPQAQSIGALVVRGNLVRVLKFARK